MKAKKIKPEIILSTIIGMVIIVLTGYYSIPKKTLVPKIDLIVSSTPKPITEWALYEPNEFGLEFEYHSSWGEPELRSNALERIIYVGPIVVTRKSTSLNNYMNALKKQKFQLKETTISASKAYFYEQTNNNKIVIENIIFSKDENSEFAYEVSYSYAKPEDKEKIDKFIQSLKAK